METKTMTYSQEGMLLVRISDMSMLKDIKKAISMVKGVENVTLPRRKRISAYERSLRDLYLYCAQHTLGSHARIVNAANFGNLYHTGPAEFIKKVNN